MNLKYLAIYLNDHLAGATAGLELVKRAAGSNEGNEYGAFMSELEHEIAEDKASLERLMERFDVKQDKVKVTGAFIAEKLGRLKPNAHLTSYSPHSRVVELEALTLGVTGKMLLWQALLAVEEADERLDADELRALRDRAQSQLQDLEPFRVRAVEDAMLAPVSA